MKFSKTLASICAASVALSSLALGAFATWKGADEYGNLCYNVADVLPEGVDISEVYGVRVTLTDASIDTITAGGAGGGFILSTKSNNWNQLQWCNGCGEDESHDIQLDVATKSITRMEETPFFTADDISGADGNYAQIVLSEWWGGDIEVASLDFLNKDGEVLPVADDPEDPVQPGETEDPEEPDDPSDPTPGDSDDPGDEPSDPDDPSDPTPGDSDDPGDEPSDPDDPSDDPTPGETTSPSEPGDDNPSDVPSTPDDNPSDVPSTPDDNPSDVPSTPDEPGEDPSTPDNPSTGDDETPDEDLGDTVDIDLSGKGTTVIDNGKVRTNIVNQWAGEDANIADKAAFKNANKITVKFTVSDFTEPFTAWLAFADSNFGAQYWGEGDAANAGVKCVPVQVTGNGTYEITLELDKAIEGDIAVLAVCTDLQAAQGDAIPAIAIDGVTVTVDSDAEPGDSDKPAEPGDSDKPAEPGNSDKPAEPGDSDKPADDDNNKPADDDNNKPADDDNNKPADDDNNKPADDNKNPASPDTGVTAAVLPAALAAASLAVAGIVLKKRK